MKTCASTAIEEMFVAPAAAAGDAMPTRLEFKSLEDRITWHVMRELHNAPDGMAMPMLVQTLSEFGPSEVRRVIEEMRGNDMLEEQFQCGC
jgi:hypothetical protein